MDNEHFNNFINQDFASFSNWLSTMDPYEFTLISTIIGFVISPTLSLNEQSSLGNFFQLIGQVLLTINAQNITLKQKLREMPGIRRGLEEITLEEEIIKIKDEIIRLRRDALNNDRR